MQTELKSTVAACTASGVALWAMSPGEESREQSLTPVWRFRLAGTTRLGIVLALVLALAPAGLWAQSNRLDNGSFELGLGSWQLPDGSTMAVVLPGHSALGVPDGTNFVSGEVGLFQDVATVPGRDYVIQFASVPPLPRVLWGGVVLEALTTNALAGLSSWQQVQCFVQAAGDWARLSFESVTVVRPSSNWVQNVVLDNVRVGWRQEPPSIQGQPQNLHLVEGASATFSVGALGGPPLCYQWRLNGGDIAGATNGCFQISIVRTNHAGAYSVLVSNAYGNVLSGGATLAVDPSHASPEIVRQPSSQILAIGYGCSLNVAAVGAPPLQYQWFLNGLSVSGATNPTYAIMALGNSNSGAYTVLVSNTLAATLSLPAQVAATNAAGGVMLYINTNPWPPKVYEVDGTTILSGPAYAAQLYVGASPDGLRPAGSVLAFPTHPFPGLLPFKGWGVPNVSSQGGTVWAQLRAWETARGATYEEARAAGGKFGFSTLVSGTSPSFVRLTIPDFHLQPGLPFFFNGVLTPGGALPDGTQQFILQGTAGFRYLIEKQVPPNLWAPFLIVTNVTGNVTFSDPQQAQGNMGLYRARILD